MKDVKGINPKNSHHKKKKTTFFLANYMRWMLNNVNAVKIS